MVILKDSVTASRYATVPEEKAVGATYTPKILSDFVAQRIVEVFDDFPPDRPLRVLDPAVGDGELLLSLLQQLTNHPNLNINVYGFETDPQALSVATTRLRKQFPTIPIHFSQDDFLSFVLDNFGIGNTLSLFNSTTPESYDLVIANPPYVRTQIMGSHQAQRLTKQFCLSGRVDLYYAFLLAIAQVLKPNGVAGVIVSNRFMSTRSGAPVRRSILEKFNLQHIWDFGDSKLFNAAVLPAVLLAKGKNGHSLELPDFTSIYETHDSPATETATPIEALSYSGTVQIDDGRQFLVRHGKLDTGNIPDGIWRIATERVDSWLETVKSYTWATFGDIGKIRVGVKTCADKVFIRSDWDDFSDGERPELLKPLITHHIARRFKALEPVNQRQILYPHEVVQNLRRAIDLSHYPKSQIYLERHRAKLESRKYIMESGRKWYEIWVPQDPSAWDQIKLVFRDIAAEPTFWIDQAGSVVNGDCYWIVCHDPNQTDLLWLAAAVGNSSFIERFYDSCFHNKLYAGRRRFITQYVEKFPLPDPHSAIAKEIIAKAKEIYANIPSPKANELQEQLERMVWQAFGLFIEKVVR
jgi:adenine-specific DNA-methyltransferase